MQNHPPYIPPYIVGIGGTSVPASSTEKALALALGAAEAAGARTLMFGHAELCALPHFGLRGASGADRVMASLLRAVRAADAIIIASPGYHGTISGLVKNALDHLEPTAKDARPYLDGMPVGLIATAYGWQAAVHTLATLRTISHGLRGWPTPFGVSINCLTSPFQGARNADEAVNNQLAMVGQQVVQAVSCWQSMPRAEASAA